MLLHCVLVGHFFKKTPDRLLVVVSPRAKHEQLFNGGDSLGTFGA
jgi:hypothetical protein